MTSLKKPILEKTMQEFDFAIDKFMKNLLLEEKKIYHSDIQPFEAHAFQINEQIKKQLEESKAAFLRGYEIVIDHVNFLARQSHVQAEKFFIHEERLEDLHGHEQAAKRMLKSSFKKGKPLQFIWGYTGDMMAAIYELAVQFYTAKDYQKAKDLLQFLTLLNPFICFFWQLFGRAFQAEEKFQEAIEAFKIAVECAPLNLESYQDAAKCCMIVKDYEAAIHILDRGIEMVPEENEELKEGLNAMKAYLQQIKQVKV